MLLADAPVDALAEQVGVPVVAGVLLDHVHEPLLHRVERARGLPHFGRPGFRERGPVQVAAELVGRR